MKKYLPWLAGIIPGFLGLCLLLLTNLSFLALCLLGIAAIALCFRLLKTGQSPAAPRLRKILIIVTAGVILLVSIPGILVLNGTAGHGDTDTEYVLVLGCAVWADGPSPTLRGRINTAYTYLTQHPDAICIVTGGKGHDEIMSEDACMASELIALGIAENRIWLEDRATSTVENLEFSLDLIEEKTGTRPEKITLISSETHLYRASLMAKDAGLSAATVPAETKPFLLKVNNGLREIAAIWKYLIMGG